MARECQPHGYIEQLKERCTDLTIAKKSAYKEAEVCPWKLRRKERELEDMTTRLEVVTHDRDELVNDLHEYEASADRMQEELYIAQKDRDRLEEEELQYVRLNKQHSLGSYDDLDSATKAVREHNSSAYGVITND